MVCSGRIELALETRYKLAARYQQSFLHMVSQE